MLKGETSYKLKIEPNLDKINQWIEEGISVKVICQRLKISRDTFYKYLKTSKDMSDILKKRNEVDERYEDIFNKQLNGYYVEEVDTNYIYIKNEKGKYNKVPTSEVVKKRWVNGGDSMYIFAAKNKLGWNDNNSVQITSSEDDPITVAIKESLK